jgi:excinuclease ABC subunit A
MTDTIKIFKANQNNLKNIDLTIPKNKLIVFTGLSGSGKSTTKPCKNYKFIFWYS